MPYTMKKFLDDAFEIFFKDTAEYRVPFPEHMQNELRAITELRFQKWFENSEIEKSDDMNSENLFAKLEDLVFETALAMAKTTEEKITIKFPELPRIGDKFHVASENGVHDENAHDNMNEIIAREVIKDGEKWIAIKMSFKYPDESGKTSSEFVIKENM